MDLDTHPNPQPNPHHRKIDLQFTQDLTYLQNNLAQSALQKLDLHFPKISKPATHISLDGATTTSQRESKQEAPGHGNNVNNKHNEDEDGEEDDPMRARVHTLVTQFLQTTWAAATPNISVNGQDATSLANPIPHTATLSAAPSPTDDRAISQGQQQPPAEVENVHFTYAKFDAGLQQKLAALHGELEALTGQVARLRRTAPGQGAELYQTRLGEVMEEDEQVFREEMQRLEREEGWGLETEGVREGWNEDVRDVYERGVTALSSLAGVGQGSGPTLTETVGKAQRAGRVAMELE